MTTPTVPGAPTGAHALVPVELPRLVAYLRPMPRWERASDDLFRALAGKVGDERAAGLLDEATATLDHESLVSSGRAALRALLADASVQTCEALAALEHLCSDQIRDPDLVDSLDAADALHHLMEASRHLRDAWRVTQVRLGSAPSDGDICPETAAAEAANRCHIHRDCDYQLDAAEAVQDGGQR